MVNALERGSTSEVFVPTYSYTLFPHLHAGTSHIYRKNPSYIFIATTHVIRTFDCLHQLYFLTRDCPLAGGKELALWKVLSLQNRLYFSHLYVPRDDILCLNVTIRLYSRKCMFFRTWKLMHWIMHWLINLWFLQMHKVNINFRIAQCNYQQERRLAFDISQPHFHWSSRTAQTGSLHSKRTLKTVPCSSRDKPSGKQPTHFTDQRYQSLKHASKYHMFPCIRA